MDSPSARRAVRRWISALGLAWLWSCNSSAAHGARGVTLASEPVREEPELLVGGGTFYTGAPQWETVEAVLARGGRVVRTGTREELRAMAKSDLDEVDLAGGVAVPGLHDAHLHLLGLGEMLSEVDLRGAASYEEVIERVAQRAAQTETGRWIRGRGWDQNLWPQAEFPHHAALSERVSAHPVLLERVDGHAVLANRLALERAGLDGPGLTEHRFPGGRVFVDDEGRATGVFVDAASQPLERALPEPDDAHVRSALLAAQAHLLELGFAAVHDMGTSLRVLRALRELEKQGAWQLRVIAYLAADEPLCAQELAAFPRPLDFRPGTGPRVLLAGRKLYADGALGSRGAKLLAGYADENAHSGLWVTAPAQIARELDRSAALGLQPAIHAIGDGANRAVLDLFGSWIVREPTARALRPRIEHAQMVERSDWPRFEALGVVPSMQPTHCTSDMRWAEARVGPERVERLYAWRKLASPTAPLAFGSDAPVERAHPLEGLYAARTRADQNGLPSGGWRAEERLSGAEALSAFTAGAAFAARLEHGLGRLEPGAALDLTVFDIDPLQCSDRALQDGNVRAVWIDGRRVDTTPRATARP